MGTFDDGGVLTGWYEFDTSTTLPNVAIDYSLSVSGGNIAVFPAFTYSPVNSFSGGGFSDAQLLVTSFDDRELTASFSSALNDPGSTPKSLTSGAEFSPGAADSRTLVSATATLEAVPEPGTVIFVATALVAILIVRIDRWRKRRFESAAPGSHSARWPHGIMPTGGDPALQLRSRVATESENQVRA